MLLIKTGCHIDEVNYLLLVLMYFNCLLLAEAAQMLARNVNYEVPALKKQVTKCKKTQQDCTRKEAEYNSLAAEYRVKYTEMCAKIGIQVSL